VNAPDARRRRSSCRHARGISLIEILVSLAIGAAALTAAVAACMKAHTMHEALQTRARLQEIARHAMAIIEADLRMAGYWGLNPRAEEISADPTLIFSAKCGGASWITETTRVIEATNGSYLTLPNCAGASGGWKPGTDVLIVRRASAQRIRPTGTAVPATHEDNVLIVTDHGSGEIFVPRDGSNELPAGYVPAEAEGTAPLVELRQFVVNAYYISRNSSVGTGYPALRRKTLVAGPEIADEEILPGVEDLQFVFGIDTDGDSNVDLIGDPDSTPAGASVVSVRVTLRAVAEDRGGTRMTLGKTVQIRNVHP
jgi:type IV pilus assembly protein PilW